MSWSVDLVNVEVSSETTEHDLWQQWLVQVQELVLLVVILVVGSNTELVLSGKLLNESGRVPLILTVQLDLNLVVLVLEKLALLQAGSQVADQVLVVLQLVVAGFTEVVLVVWVLQQLGDILTSVLNQKVVDVRVIL